MPPAEAEEQPVAGSGSGAPCGACRTLRRRCLPGCVFAPYFTASDFAAVHAVFGASNASKMLERVGASPEERAAAAATLVEEARARAADPTFGRVAYLRILQEVNDKARAQVDDARAQIAAEFGAAAAALPVDVAAAAPEVRAEARRQAEAALKHAREQDARLVEVRRENEARWRELHPEEEGGAGSTGKLAEKGIEDAKRRREPTMLMPPRPAKQRRPPPGFRDERERQQQMAAADAEREEALLMRQAAAHAKQHGHHHHLAAQHGETGPPRVPEVCGNGQLHQQMSETSREEAMRSVQAPAAARYAGDGAAGGTPGQGGTSVLLEAMMQLAGAGDEQQQPQHLVARHADKEYEIAKGMMQLQELLGMAELARTQQVMKDDVMAETGQWDAAAGGAMEQDDVMTTMATMQQIPANTWHHNDPVAQYAGMRDGPQEMPQQMEELAQTTTGNVAQQLAWAHQQYHDYPAEAVHHGAVPWHHQMAEAHQPAAASLASQAASEQDMLLLLQQHQVTVAESLLSAGGARQFGNLAAQYDDTELTLGYGHHPDMHQQVAAAGQVARVQDMNSRHAQTGLDIDAETQAMLQELAALLEPGGKDDMIREQDVMTTMTQQDHPDAAWLLERLEQMEKESMQELAKRQAMISRQAEARHAQKELGMTTEMKRKQEMLMRRYVAAERAREQELIAQQAAPAQQHPVAQQYSGTELGMTETIKRKREMLMRRFVAAERAREQELMARQAAAAQQYSGISPGHGHWHQPTVQPLLQEQQQQLADAVGFGGHQPNTAMVLQQEAAYVNGGHGSGAGATMAFLPPESAKDTRLLVGQQPQPNGHQLSQLHAQASHQQRTDGWRWPGPDL